MKENKHDKANNKNKVTSRPKYLLTLVSGVVILAALVASYAFVWYEFYSKQISRPYDTRGHWLIIAVYSILLFALTRMYGGYRVGSATLGDVIYSSLLSMLFVNAITYLQISLLCARFPNIIPLLFLCITDAVIIIIWASSAKAISYKFFPPQSMLLIYGTNFPEDIVTKINTRPDRYNICSTISMEQGMDAVLERLSHFDAVIISEVKSHHRNSLIKYCYDRSVRTYLVPKISDIIIRGAESLTFFDTPLLLSRNRGLSTEQRVMKRIFDIFLSFVGILITSPIMLICAIAIKLCDRGPVFFRQERCTIGGRKFSIFKFRSMVVDAEKDGIQLAQKDDLRITPVGKFLRSIRLDELPQLFNILMGDMSFVGPRPERSEYIDKFVKDVPEFMFRMRVKGGLTGYAQIIGKYNTSPLDKLKLDLMYIENYSFLLDLKLVFMTVKILFIKQSSEGVDEKNTTFKIDED